MYEDFRQDSLEKSVIFISYRRQGDLCFIKQLLREMDLMLKRSKWRKSRYEVFCDIAKDAIPHGTPYQDVLNSKIQRSQVVVAVIEHDWQSILDKRRGEPETDHLVAELTAALKLPNVLITPVYIANAPQLKAENLPEGLKRLAYLQSTRIGAPPEHDFEGGILAFVTSIQDHLENKREPLYQIIAARLEKTESWLWSIAIEVNDWLSIRRELLFSKRGWSDGFRSFPSSFVLLILPIWLCFHAYLCINARWPMKMGAFSGNTAALFVASIASPLVPFVPIELAKRYESYYGRVSHILYRSGRACISISILAWLPILYGAMWVLNYLGIVKWIDEYWGLVFK